MKLYKAILMMEREQQSAAVIPDNYTYPFVLKACAYLFSLSEGKQTWHTRILYDKRYNLFHYPVSDEDAPNYHSIIQNSMDMVYNGEDYNGDRIVSRACQLRDVHGMISQMDPTLVAYGDKIVAQGGPVHLSNELRWSTFPATPVVQLGTATRLSARLRNEIHVKLKFQMIRQINLLG
ncbi:hypothetical protein HN51_003960 [Arachis hypogaea]